MEHSKSLAPHTGKVFDAISRLECIKPFTLVGGTALSLQIEKRQSEDLDFMIWQKKKNDKCFVNKDGKFIMINKSDLDKYLSNGYERGKTSSMAKKEDVLEYYLQGHTIDETHHHFHIDPEAVKEKLGIKKEDPNRWFYKDGRSIKLKVNKEL